jgi:pimeloyl-ACP methyl ester carboxylesterase
MAEDGPHWNQRDVPEVRNCSPTAAAETWSSSSCARSDRPRKTSRERGGSPFWPPLEALAHTLAYDAACMGDGPPPTARLARITQPTLVATGGGTPDAHAGGLPSGLMDRAADAIAASIPQAERQVIGGAGHMVDAKLVAPVLERFFGR